MPMLRPLVRSPFLRRRVAAALVAACAVAGAALAPAPASAQFTGNQDNDLTTRNTGSSVNDGTTTNITTPDSTADSDDSRGNNTNSNGRNSNSLRTNGSNPSDSTTRRGNGASDQPEPRAERRPVYQPGEFELYAQKRVGGSTDARRLRRLGADLLADPALASAAQDPLPFVPGDYIVRAGDEIALTIWGTADADLHLTVDRAGSIAVPRIGSIQVAGLKSADLAGAISRRVGQVFKNFQVAATLGQVRAIRVFVGGYVQQPGSITINGLSSVLHAVMRAGGPSAAGSFRDIHLRRGGRELAALDLYDLLLKGSRDTDQLVQPDDVIFIGPVGVQVAVFGSVNQQAIYELKPGEKLADALAMAGGFNAVADRSRVAIERLADRSAGRVTELALPAHASDPLATGDIIRAYSSVTADLPSGLQNQSVRVEGEVLRPGDYILPPGSHVADALRAAGGLTPAAYPYGTEFTRESVRRTQQINYELALRDLETDISKNQASQRATSAEEISAQSSSAQSNAKLLDRLRQIRPTGRVVLQLAPDASNLPDLPLEDGDVLKVPPRSSAVGVFGSVFTTGSFVFEAGHTTEQYLALAGGPKRGADKDSIFMIRANGSVISARQGSTFWSSSNTFRDAIVQPGDTIFVPEEINKSTFVQDAKDWTQILYQFGLGLAGLNALGL
ncbi:MAG: SLBB domain-containing protein [Betaproteobacteria bacterium]